MSELQASVLDYWFGPPSGEEAGISARASLWWGGHPEVDTHLRTRFGALHRAVVAGDHDAWGLEPGGRLALILVLDQFSRHLFRGQAQAFECDPLARRLCWDGLALGHDRGLSPLRRVFFYLPLQHSESCSDQDRSLDLNEALVAIAPDAQRTFFEDFATHAREHRELIRRYGRFPTRNAALGRSSTPEEAKYLHSH